MESAKEEQILEIPRKTLEDLIDALSHLKTDKLDRISIFTTALDDFVHVNSLFSIVVFLGLTFDALISNQPNLETGCHADSNLKKRLITYQLTSFLFFLLSSLAAKALKIQLNFSRHSAVKNNYDTDCGRGSLMSLAAAASCVGIVFLMVSITTLIQVRIGTLHCGSEFSFHAVVLTYAVVIAALIIYLFPMVRAIRESAKLLDGK